MEPTSKLVSKADVLLFTSQVLLLFIVVITSLVNLSIDRGNTNLWTMILTSCLGYMMPNPKLKSVATKDKSQDTTTSSTPETNGVVLRHLTLQRQGENQQ